MTRRIPHGESPVEIRKGFQRMAKQTDVITDGPVGAVLVGAGSGTTPIWGTELTALTLLTVDDITINGATISSGTGAISFSDDNLTTTGSISGVNVTSGLNPGHIHSGTSLTIDHGADLTGLGDDDHGLYHTDARGDARYYTETELDAGQLDTRYFTEAEHLNTSAGAADAGKPIKLDAAGHVDATMINDGDIDHGSIGGLGGDDHAIYSLADGTRAFTGVVGGIDPTSASHLATKEYVDQTVNFIQDFYFNDTVSDIGGGSYYQMEELLTGEASSSFTNTAMGAGDGQSLVAMWVTEAGHPGTTFLAHGTYSVHIHAARTVGNRETRIYFELWRWEVAGPGTETLIATSELSPEVILGGIAINLHATLASEVEIGTTDRLIIKFLANLGTGSPTTLVLYAEGVSSSRFAMPIGTEVLSSIFLRQDGTKDLTGDLAVDPGITIDGRDIRLDGMDLDTLVTLIGKMKVDTSATADYLGAAFSDGALRTSTGISYADGGNFITLTTNDGEIVHDSLSGFDANKHVDHTGVSIATAATSGIAGGGTIAATRNLSLNINGLAGESAIVAADTLAFYDDTAGANRKVTLAQLSTALGAADEKVKVDSGATAGYLGAAAGDGVLRVTGALSYVDGGDFVTLGGSGSVAKAHLNTNQDIVTGTFTRVDMDVVLFDPEGSFVGDSYIAPATGYYFVCGKARTNEVMSTGKILSVYVYVNGVQQTTNRIFSDGVQTSICVISDIVYAESGQSIELWVRHNHGSNRQLTATDRNALTVHRLS